MATLLTYSRFQTPEDSQDLLAILNQHNIPYELEKEPNPVGSIYFGETLDPMISLRIPADKFDEVNSLLARKAEQDFSQPGFEHYLQSFEKSELEDLLTNPFDWSAYDIQIAKLLLRSAPSQTQIVDFKPETLEIKWLIIGYINSLL